MAVERQIDDCLARQFGVISREQALSLGLTGHQTAYRLATGEWSAITPGVYAVSSSAPTWRRSLAAAVLSRPRAIVTGGAAARILGYEGFQSARPEIMIPHHGNARCEIATVVRSRWFDHVQRIRADAFEMTSEAETLLVLSRSMSSYRLGRLIDARVTGHHLSLGDFDPIRHRIAGTRLRGGRRLLDLVDERSDGAWRPPASDLERHLDRLVDDPSVPPSTRQLPLSVAGIPMVVDRYIALWRVVLEADGRPYHTRLSDFERDRARDNAAAANGIVVLRYTWKMLTNDFDGCRRTLLATGATRT